MPYMLNPMKRRALARACYSALALVLLAFAAGCDSGGDDDEDQFAGGDVSGLWQALSQNVLYLDIDVGAEEFVIIDYLGDAVDNEADCYLTTLEAEIVDVEGERYTLLGPDGQGGVDAINVFMRTEGDELIFSTTEGGTGTRFNRSNDDLSPSCDGDDDDDDDDGGGGLPFGLNQKSLSELLPK